MRAVKISEIFGIIEESNKNVLMLLNAEYTNDEKKLIIQYAKVYEKEIKFATMKEFIFNQDDNILKFK